MRFSLYPDIESTYRPRVVELDDLRQIVREDQALKDWTERVQQQPTKELRNAVKRNLPNFTCAVWKDGHRHNNSELDEHSGTVPLDFDELCKLGDEDTLQDCVDSLSLHPGVVWIYRSASGIGLRALVAVSPTPRSNKEHAAAWHAASNSVREQCQMNADKLADLPRANYLSYDPQEWHRAVDELQPVGWSIADLPDEPPAATQRQQGASKSSCERAIALAKGTMIDTRAGNRHKTLADLAGNLSSFVPEFLTEDAFKQTIEDIAACSDKEWEQDEVKDIILWALTSNQAANPKQQVAEIIAQELAQANYINVSERYGDWHLWQQANWLQVDERHMRAKATVFLRHHKVKTPTLHMKNDILQHAADTYCLPSAAIYARDLDPEYRGPFDLTNGDRVEGVAFNDVIVFQDGTTRPITKDIFFPTPTLPFPYLGPDDEPPLFRDLIASAIDAAIPWRFILRYMGAALMGDRAHQHFINLWGKEGTGKTTLAAIIELLLGTPLAFGHTDALAGRFALADLPKHRFILLPDTPADFASNSAGLHVLKSLVGSDPVRCEVKHGQAFAMKFGGMVLSHSNFQLQLTRDIADAGAWRRRIIPIQFEHQSPVTIEDYADQIWEAEGELIARLAVKEYLRYRGQFRKSIPQVILDARESIVQANISNAAEYVLTHFEYAEGANTYQDTVAKYLDTFNAGVVEAYRTRSFKKHIIGLGARLSTTKVNGAVRKVYKGLAIREEDGEVTADYWDGQQGNL